MPPKRAAAKRARTPEPDQPATRPPIAEASADSMIPSASEVTAALAKYPKQPMKALWDVLTDPNNKGPEMAMAIVRHKSCGLERKTGRKDGFNLSTSKGTHKFAVRYFVEGTPLLMALYANRPDVAQALIEAGADFRAVTKIQVTALHYAALHDNVPFIDTLLGLGVKIDSEDGVGETPLHFAASTGSLNALSYLISKGANVNLKGKNCSKPNCLSPLMVASMCGHTKAVEMLISHHAEVNVMTDLGETALHYAVEYGHVDVMKVLVANRADVNIGLEDKSPYFFAAIYGQASAVEFLADNGADVNIENSIGWNALHYAVNAEAGESIISVLIAKGTKVNAQASSGWTALHLAAICRKTKAVEALLQGGADRFAKDANGETPLQIAEARGDAAVVAILKAPNAAESSN